MKKEKLSNVLRSCIIGFLLGVALIIIFLTGVSVGKNAEAKKVRSLIELGTKISDVKWLEREGMLSEEEIEKFNKFSENLNYEELNQLLDELLDGKEEKLLKEREELNKRIDSILNS